MSALDRESLQARHRDLDIEIESEGAATADGAAELRVTVAAEHARTLLARLFEESEGGARRLVDLTVIDRGPGRGATRFEVVYRLESLDRAAALRVHVRTREVEPVVDSVADLWPAAGWLEREAFDLFGIGFSGHADLRRLLLDPDWKGAPLRKDEPLGGETR